MNKRNFIVVLTLTVIQLSIVRATDEHNETISEIKERLNSLEISTQHLQIIFDNAIRIIAAQINNPKNFLRNLTSTVDDIKLELEMLKQTIEVQKYSQQLLLAEIVDDIKSRDFKTAARKLRNLNGADLNKNINLIVHEVYNNQAGNFKLIILFGQYKDIDVETNLAVYEALNFEMESNNHHDFLKLLELISSFEKRFHGTGDDPGVVPNSATKFIRQHIEVVEKVVEDELLKAIKSNNFNAVDEVLEKIHQNYPEFFEVLIIDVIGVEKLVNLFRTYKYSPQQSIWVYSAIFNALQKRNDLNEPSVVSLAFALKEALNDTRISKDSRDIGEKVKQDLPESVRNLAFAQRVCIKSAFYPNQFLFAFTDIRWNPKDHTVFTAVKGGSVDNTIWVIEERGDGYNIKNEDYQEYMYVKNSSVYLGFPESVNHFEGFTWVFQPNGRNVYIQIFDNYLYASIVEYKSPDDNYWRNIVVAPIDHGENFQENKIDGYLWLIEDCSNVFA